MQTGQYLQASSSGRGFLRKYVRGHLAYLKRMAREEDQDIFILITGKERRGKSCLATHLGQALDDDFSPRRNTLYADQTFEDFVDIVKGTDPGHVVHVDEFQWIALSHDWSKIDAKMLVKIMMTIGSANIIFIGCIPHIRNLHIYLRGHRAAYWWNVITRSYRDDEGLLHTKRGLVELAKARESKYKQDIYWQPLPWEDIILTFPPPGRLYTEEYLPLKRESDRTILGRLGK